MQFTRRAAWGAVASLRSSEMIGVCRSLVEEGAPAANARAPVPVESRLSR
jgi:hypothetical protein